MNFSGINQRSLAGQLLRFPLRLIPKNAIVPIFQGKLKGYKWIAGSSNHGCWLGSYEYEKQRLISATVKAGTVAYDIGAHVGFYTLLFSELVGASGKVFAFEPLPENINYLQKHIAINHITNTTLLESAVSDTSGTIAFQRGAGTSMGRIANSGDFEVTQTSIDDLINQKKIPVPNYIKMDIEGAEFKGLTGANLTLQKHHPIIFLATHGKDIHRNCCDFLSNIGYTLNSADGRDIHETDEIIAT